MASFTVTTSAAEDTALAAILTKVNANRTSRGLPTITTAQLVQQEWGKCMVALRTLLRSVRLSAVPDALQNATEAQLDQVQAALGVSDGGIGL